ncbi:MAG: SprT-like domain-containing protein [Muribaculaceae bacterium]|nr:SprT-like domain-containing protein [Muribaculaceae bacterium]
MKLSLPYLNERYNYWKQRIAEAGIWDVEKFGPVTIVIRPNCKSYNGLFIRRYLTVDGKRQLVDRIFIYNKVEDFDPKFLDSILVHEMIHQYIFQNRLKDRGPHGPLFRGFMNRINLSFGKELNIKVADRNPDAKRPEMDVVKLHIIHLMHLETGFSYCSVINPKKIRNIEQIVRDNSEYWKIKERHWAYSYDPIFNRYTKCTRSIHGIRKARDEMEEFCRQHNIILINKENSNNLQIPTT